MNSLNELIQTISKQYGIKRGDVETDVSYFCRIVYSVAGIMGYASLYDETETEEDNTVKHFKACVTNTVQCYINTIPEIEFIHSKEISDEIYSVLLNAGALYHSDYRCAPARKNLAKRGNMTFIRGASIDDVFFLSGVGTYRCGDNSITGDTDVRGMFMLQNQKIDQKWRSIYDRMKFKKADIPEDMEFLRTDGYYNRGYWKTKPEDNIYSISRVGGVNGTYYIYNYTDVFIIAPIEKRYVENYRYRSLANGILKQNKTLPPALVKRDGDIVRLKIQYLYPPRELNMMKLYSWPVRYNFFPNDFERIFSSNVFSSIKEIMEELGYEFMEG